MFAPNSYYELDCNDHADKDAEDAKYVLQDICRDILRKGENTKFQNFYDLLIERIIDTIEEYREEPVYD